MNDGDDGSIFRWFFVWLADHQKLHPGRNWVDPDSPDAMDFYRGWMEALVAAGATEDLARRASRLMQSRKVFQNEQLQVLVETIRDLRRSRAVVTTDARPDPGLVSASIASHGCPECGGEGWALRLFVWHSIRRPFRVTLFCRCPAGRWRKAHDPELSRGDRTREHDDLQARPDLWTPGLSFAGWSRKPCSHDIDMSEYDGEWHYLPPGAEPPATKAPRELARDI